MDKNNSNHYESLPTATASRGRRGITIEVYQQLVMDKQELLQKYPAANHGRRRNKMDPDI